MENKYLIPVNGLAPGKTEYAWSVGKEFFEEFDNTEVLDADLLVKVVVEKSGRHIVFDCNISGVITVSCDRCLADLGIPVDTQAGFSVRYEGQDSGAEAEREVISLSENDAELDLRQIIYDYACLALPMQRVHPEGECDPEVTKYIGGQRTVSSDDGVEVSPFATLNGMFD